MKKYFLIGIAVLFLAAACNKQQAPVQPAPVPDSREMSFSGKLIAGGAECPLFQTDDGKQYTLTGNLSGFKESDAVVIKGKLLEISYCQQGEGTIAISSVNIK